MSREEEANTLLDLLILQYAQTVNPKLTETEAVGALKRYQATRAQILELMGVD